MDAQPVVLKVLLQHRHLQLTAHFAANTTELLRKLIRLYEEVGQARHSSTGGFPVN